MSNREQHLEMMLTHILDVMSGANPYSKRVALDLMTVLLNQEKKRPLLSTMEEIKSYHLSVFGTKLGKFGTKLAEKMEYSKKEANKNDDFLDSLVS